MYSYKFYFKRVSYFLNKTVHSFKIYQTISLVLFLYFYIEIRISGILKIIEIIII